MAFFLNLEKKDQNVSVTAAFIVALFHCRTVCTHLLCCIIDDDQIEMHTSLHFKSFNNNRSNDKQDRCFCIFYYYYYSPLNKLSGGTATVFYQDTPAAFYTITAKELKAAFNTKLYQNID